MIIPGMSWGLAHQKPLLAISAVITIPSGSQERFTLGDIIRACAPPQCPPPHVAENTSDHLSIFLNQISEYRKHNDWK